MLCVHLTLWCGFCWTGEVASHSSTSLNFTSSFARHFLHLTGCLRDFISSSQNVIWLIQKTHHECSLNVACDLWRPVAATSALDPPLVTHYENGCFEWQLKVTSASILPVLIGMVRCPPVEYHVVHVHLTHSALSPWAFHRMVWRCSVSYVFSSPFLSSHPNHHVSNHSQASFPFPKCICLHTNTFYMLLQPTGFKMMGPNLIQILQMSKKSCVNLDLKLKHKGEGDKLLDD